MGRRTSEPLAIARSVLGRGYGCTSVRVERLPPGFSGGQVYRCRIDVPALNANLITRAGRGEADASAGEAAAPGEACLKRLPAGIDRSRVRQIHAVIEDARTRGCDFLPRSIRTVDGDACWGYDDSIWELWSWRPGAPLADHLRRLGGMEQEAAATTDRSECLQSAGEALARFHASAGRRPAEEDRSVAEDSVGRQSGKSEFRNASFARDLEQAAIPRPSATSTGPVRVPAVEDRIERVGRLNRSSHFQGLLAAGAGAARSLSRSQFAAVDDSQGDSPDAPGGHSRNQSCPTQHNEFPAGLAAVVDRRPGRDGVERVTEQLSASVAWLSARWPAESRRVAETLAAYRQSTTRLAWCLRDVHAEHILFGDSPGATRVTRSQEIARSHEVTGIIDFGSLRRDTVATDLARYVGSVMPFCVDSFSVDLRRRLGSSGRAGLPEEDAFSVAWTQQREQDWRSILAGYRRQRPLTDWEERLAGELAWATDLISLANWVEWLLVQRRRFPVSAGVVADRLSDLLLRVRFLGN